MSDETRVSEGSPLAMGLDGVLRTQEMRDRQCGTKLRYSTYQGALLGCISLLLRTGEETEPYRCPFCGYLHTGHPIGHGKARKK